jgi:hypothetical protein
MPITYSLDQMNRVVRSRAWGMLSNDDLHSYYHKLIADVRFNRDFRELFDLSGVGDFLVETYLIAEVAAWPAFQEGTRRAFVAVSDLAFGLSRMFATHADCVGQRVEVFRATRDAEEWLDYCALWAPELPPSCAA